MTEKMTLLGNLKRAKGGVHWIVVGSSFLLFCLGYIILDIAKSFYPKSANELHSR